MINDRFSCKIKKPRKIEILMWRMIARYNNQRKSDAIILVNGKMVFWQRTFLETEITTFQLNSTIHQE